MLRDSRGSAPRHKLDVGVLLRKDAEDFISKRLADHVHLVKLKYDHFEPINPRQ